MYITLYRYVLAVNALLMALYSVWKFYKIYREKFPIIVSSEVVVEIVDNPISNDKKSSLPTSTPPSSHRDLPSSRSTRDTSPARKGSERDHSPARGTSKKSVSVPPKVEEIDVPVNSILCPDVFCRNACLLLPESNLFYRLHALVSEENDRKSLAQIYFSSFFLGVFNCIKMLIATPEFVETNFVVANVIYGINVTLCFGVFCMMGYKILKTNSRIQNNQSKNSAVSEAIIKIRRRYIFIFVEGCLVGICTTLVSIYPRDSDFQFLLLRIWNGLTAIQIFLQMVYLLIYFANN